MSFDNHYYEADKLCAVNVTVHYKDGEKKGPYPTVMAPVPAAISENFPEDIESATVVRVQSRSNTLFNGSTRLEPKVILADSLFRTMGIEVLKVTRMSWVIRKPCSFPRVLHEKHLAMKIR